MMGFSSTHRSGKTTTAKRVAADLHLDFFDGSFGKLAAELGYNAVAGMDIERRIEMQEKCLALHVEKIRALPRPCITDRTPIDFMAYALADVPMVSDMSRELSARVHAYAENCLRLTREHYGAIVVLNPLPIYTIEAGKPGPCPAYQMHIQLLIEGAMSRVSSRTQIVRVPTFDLEARVEASSDFFTSFVRDLMGHHFDAGVH